MVGADQVKKRKEFIPNPKQIKMAELLINPDDRRTKADKCKEVGISHKTLCQWLKDERFVKYMNSRLSVYTDSELPEVWKALINQCKRGNVAAMKEYFKLKQLYPDTLNW
jgi:hypothetical protein